MQLNTIRNWLQENSMHENIVIYDN